MSERERLALVIGLGCFELLCALAGAFIAWRKGRNPWLWFLVGLAPILGQFATLFFLLLPEETPVSDSAAAPQPATRGRKVMSLQERRVAFALICYLVVFTLATGSVKMPGWLRVLLVLGGCLVLFGVFGPRNQRDKPNPGRSGLDKR